ncbi:MAG: MFS transporter [Micromonosporaceae bacterium]
MRPDHSGSPARGGVRELLGRRDYRRLFLGQAASGLGDWMATVGLIVLVLKLTGSSVAVGGVLVLRLLPSLVAAPLAARAATRLGRRRSMLGMDVIRSLCAVALPLWGTLGWIYGWAFAIEVAGLVFLPARDASIPALIGEHGDDRRLSLANALMVGASYGMIPVGAAAFMLVYWGVGQAGLGGPSLAPFVAVFWIDALTFLVSFAAIRRIAAGHTEDPGAAEQKAAGVWAGLRIPLVRAVLPALMCVTVGVGALFSAGVAYVQKVIGASPAVFGALIALFGVGACAALAIRPLTGRLSALTRVRVGAVALGLVMGVMGLLAVTALALLGAFLYGAAATVTLVAAMSLMQERLRGTERSLGFVAVHVSSRIGLSVAALAMGAVADLAPSLEIPLAGRLSSVQLVLAAAGSLVVLGGLIAHDSSAIAPRAQVDDRRRAGARSAGR